MSNGSRGIHMPAPEVAESMEWQVGDNKGPSIVAQEMMEWRVVNGAPTLGELGKTKASNGDFRHPVVFFVDEGGVKRGYSGQEPTDFGRDEERAELLFAQPVTFIDGVREVGILPNLGDMVFGEEDVLYERDFIVQLLAERLSIGVNSPEKFCPHACERHTPQVVAWTCSQVLGSIQNRTHRLDIYTSSTKPKKRPSSGLEYPRLRLSVSDPIQISQTGYKPQILAALLEYYPHALERKTLSCSLATVLTAFALARVPVSPIFDVGFAVGPDGLNRIGYRGLHHHIGFKSSRFCEIRDLYGQMVDESTKNNWSNNEALSFFSKVFHALGHDVSDMWEKIDGVRGISVRPQIVFDNFYLDEKDYRRRSGLAPGEVDAVAQAYGLGFFSDTPVTAFPQFLYNTKKAGFLGSKSLVRKLKDQGMLL